MAQRNDLRSEELRERSSEEIRQDIFERRKSLSNTIEQLGSQHPYIAMSAAAGLGFLLSKVFKPSPAPGKRMMGALHETVENVIDTVRDSFQGLFHKTRPDIITMLTTIVLQAGGGFLLTKIKKNASDQKVSSNGVHNEEA